MPPDIADMPSASVAFSMMFGERPQEEVSDRGGLFYKAKCAPRRSRQVVCAPVCFQMHASRVFLSAREHWLQRGQHGSFIVCVELLNPLRVRAFAGVYDWRDTYVYL